MGGDISLSRVAEENEIGVGSPGLACGLPSQFPIDTTIRLCSHCPGLNCEDLSAGLAPQPTMIFPLVRRELQCAIHDGRVHRRRLIVTGVAVGIVAILMQMGLRFGGIMLLVILIAATSMYFQSQTQQLQEGSPHPLYNRHNAAIAVFAFLMILLSVLLPSQPPSGAMLLRLGILVLFPAIVIEGFRGSIDCLSAERRNGTLGLLLLTRLRGLDIVLGKLAGSSLSGLLQLVAILPILFFSMFLGGVRGDEFARVSLALLEAYALSCCFGVWISARSSMAHNAFIQAFTSVVVVFLMPAVLWLSPALLKSAWLAIPMSVSPGLMLTTSFDASYRMDPGVWQRAAYSIPLLCVGLLVAAGAHTRHWRPGSNETATPEARRKGAISGDLIDREPLLWLARTQGGNLAAGIKLAGVAILICALVQWLQAATTPWQETALIPMPANVWTRLSLEPGMLAAAALIQVAYAARLCRTASSLFQDGSFELLTVAGADYKRISRAILRSQLREFVAPIVIVGLLIVEAFFFNQRMIPEFLESRTNLEHLQTVAITFVMIALYAASFIAIHQVGLWFSLKRGEPFSATINTWLIINTLLIGAAAALIYGAPDMFAVLVQAALAPFYATTGASNSIKKRLQAISG